MLPYVEKRASAYYVTGTRVSMASVVHHFQLGASPETILQKFPALKSLNIVYGAITFYLENRELIDDSIARQQRELSEFESIADPPPQSFVEGVKPIRSGP
jgi:uncharacterized protein (DUF433 family)